MIIVVVFLSSCSYLSIDTKAHFYILDNYNDRFAFAIRTQPLRPQSSLIYYAGIIKKCQLNSYHHKRTRYCRRCRLFSTSRHRVHVRRRPKQNVRVQKPLFHHAPPPSARHTRINNSFICIISIFPSPKHRDV